MSRIAMFAVMLVIGSFGLHAAATAQSLNQTGDAGAPLGSVLATLDVGN